MLEQEQGEGGRRATRGRGGREGGGREGGREGREGTGRAGEVEGGRDRGQEKPGMLTSGSRYVQSRARIYMLFACVP